jgi:hypothetical protein
VKVDETRGKREDRRDTREEATQTRTEKKVKGNTKEGRHKIKDTT